MRNIVAPRTTKGAARRRGPANPMKIRMQKNAVTVTTKARELATDRAGEGQLLRCYFRDLSREKR